MKTIGRQLAAFSLLALLLLTSCGQQYTTPLYNDPLFRQPELDPSPLAEDGEVWTQRDWVFASDGKFQPRPNENFDEYLGRLLNTFVMQDLDLQSLKEMSLQKEVQTEELEKQLKILHDESLAMRLRLAQYMVEESGGIPLHSTFRRYEIERGDTLRDVAFREYNNYEAWLALYRFNFEFLPGGPNRIKPGDVIVLPSMKKKLNLLLHQKAAEKTQ
ncbi:hypothetical protein JYU14_03745 [Simkania negevensis]|uniref:LysM domain-containing protein n=1 Tax=Simkania negevensis TaxID=83561 RepID=A0ABS3AU84_9BACT|nr:hypothetical protein [Simkania negevensis]